MAADFRSLKIGFIGAGNMAKAIGGGLVKCGYVKASQIGVHAPSRRNSEFWAELGAEWFDTSAELYKSCCYIFLAMKPHNLRTAVSDIGERLSTNKCLPEVWVSVLAGVTLKTLEEVLGKSTSDTYFSHSPIIIRVMPNTPMQVGHGCSVFCGNSRVQPEHIKEMSAILGSLGKSFEVKEELIDAIASISGCGPAYMFSIIDAMADAGVKMGVPRALAIQLAAQTMVGAGQMVLQTGRHPGVLKDEVCSPGGSTIVGLHTLERNGVRAGIIDTLEAAAAKNKELGKLG